MNGWLSPQKQGKPSIRLSKILPLAHSLQVGALWSLLCVVLFASDPGFLAGCSHCSILPLIFCSGGARAIAFIKWNLTRMSQKLLHAHSCSFMVPTMRSSAWIMLRVCMKQRTFPNICGSSKEQGIRKGTWLIVQPIIRHVLTFFEDALCKDVEATAHPARIRAPAAFFLPFSSQTITSRTSSTKRVARTAPQPQPMPSVTDWPEQAIGNSSHSRCIHTTKKTSQNANFSR